MERLPGVIAYDVDLGSDSATVLYDPGKASISDLEGAVARAGFRVRGVQEVSN